METREEAMADTTNNSSSSVNSEYSHPIVKGKRTKRQRLLQLPAPAAFAASSTSSSGELSGSTNEEEEDMANCLILLAQGRALDAGPKSEARLREDGGGGDGGGERVTSRRFAEAATTTNGKAGLYVYECKTCNKRFRSFQALGGHRSSHKKPKTAPVTAAATEEKREMDEDGLQISIASNPNILPSNNTTFSAATPTLNSIIITNNNSSINNNKSRVHECSICGSEFSSGQALGGHMRRHRTATPQEPQEVKKEKSILSLDLNLPAPADDDRGDYPESPSFAFAGSQPLLFSSSALVDCHY